MLDVREAMEVVDKTGNADAAAIWAIVMITLAIAAFAVVCYMTHKRRKEEEEKYQAQMRLRYGLDKERWK